MKEMGATLVDPADLPSFGKYDSNENIVLQLRVQERPQRLPRRAQDRVDPGKTDRLQPAASPRRDVLLRPGNLRRSAEARQPERRGVPLGAIRHPAGTRRRHRRRAQEAQGGRHRRPWPPYRRGSSTGSSATTTPANAPPPPPWPAIRTSPFPLASSKGCQSGYRSSGRLGASRCCSAWHSHASRRPQLAARCACSPRPPSDRARASRPAARFPRPSSRPPYTTFATTNVISSACGAPAANSDSDFFTAFTISAAGSVRCSFSTSMKRSSSYSF